MMRASYRCDKWEAHMRKRIRIIIVAGMVLAAVFPLAAQDSEKPVGLGVSLGLAFPQGGTDSIEDSETSFDWGFYVNIPLIYSFHITPSAELYGLADMNATDIDIAFKFIVPLSDFSVYGGFSPGVTAVGDTMPLHVGLLAGGSMKLVSNLDAFAQLKYTFLFEGGRNMSVFHLNAGILFNFSR